jgi:hypothetical protein
MTRSNRLYSMAVFAAFTCLALGGFTRHKESSRQGTLAGAQAKQGSAQVQTSQARPPRGIDSGNPNLARAVREVMKACEVTDYGFLRGCKGEAEKSLVEQERVVGAKEALLTYCRAMVDENHVVRTLAAARMSRLNFFKTIQEAADERGLGCLMEMVPRTKQSSLARQLIRAATLMATALEKEDRVLELLEKSNSVELKAIGVEALWANGRLRIWERLTKLLEKTKETEVRVAVINGFSSGGRLSAEEKDKVCGLLAPLVTHDELRVASNSALRVVELCPDLRDKVLDGAEAMIERKVCDLTYVSAVRSVNGFFDPRSSPTQRKRSVAIFSAILKSAEFPDLVRSAALRNLAGIEKKLAMRLAKTYAKDSTPYLRASAEEILRKK